MTRYNGHKNWNHWNVSLWINNDEGLYRMANESGGVTTPLGLGHVPKRELYYQLHAFVRGLEIGKGESA